MLLAWQATHPPFVNTPADIVSSNPTLRSIARDALSAGAASAAACDGTALTGTLLALRAFTIGVAGEIIENYDDAFGSTTLTGLAVADESDLWAAQIGGSYGWDAWTIGLGWTHTEAEITSNSDEDTIDYVSLNGAYALGPGIDLEGNVGYVNYEDDDNAQNADYDAFEIGFGTAISF